MNKTNKILLWILLALVVISIIFAIYKDSEEIGKPRFSRKPKLPTPTPTPEPEEAMGFDGINLIDQFS